MLSPDWPVAYAVEFNVKLHVKFLLLTLLSKLPLFTLSISAVKCVVVHVVVNFASARTPVNKNVVTAVVVDQSQHLENSSAAFPDFKTLSSILLSVLLLIPILLSILHSILRASFIVLLLERP